MKPKFGKIVWNTESGGPIKLDQPLTVTNSDFPKSKKEQSSLLGFTTEELFSKVSKEERNVVLTGDPYTEFDPHTYILCYSFPEQVQEYPHIQEFFQHILPPVHVQDEFAPDPPSSGHSSGRSTPSSGASSSSGSFHGFYQEHHWIRTILQTAIHQQAQLVDWGAHKKVKH